MGSGAPAPFVDCGRSTPTVPGAATVKRNVLVSRQNIELLRLVEFAEALRQTNLNSPRGNVNRSANVLRKRNEQFPRRSLHLQERCPGSAFTGKIYVVDGADNARGVF